MLLRTVADLEFPTPIVVRPFGGDTDVAASASVVSRLRGGQGCVFLRLDSGGHALAIASDSSSWTWPSAGAAAQVVLFRAAPDRWFRSELRRLGDPQRRDALYRAALVEAAG